MPVSESQRRANAKYDKENFEYCTVKVKKGKKTEFQTHAESCGESLNSFMNRAANETIERDNAKGEKINASM